MRIRTSHRWSGVGGLVGVLLSACVQEPLAPTPEPAGVQPPAAEAPAGPLAPSPPPAPEPLPPLAEPAPDLAIPIPDWLNAIIAKFQADPVGNPPRSIWRYQYKGGTVYYFPPQCCDQQSVLKDASGAFLCAPDGGFDGQGDGRCPDFYKVATERTLVWRDPRRR